jgi:glycosyltransferase involved in cell wall biosynthesis
MAAATSAAGVVVPVPVTIAVHRSACAKVSGEPMDDVGAPEKPRLTAVICTYDRYDVLPEALASLLAQDCAPGFLETIVVDNSPDQVAAATFGGRYADENRIRYLLETTPGLSNARNVGTREARADLVAFIDDDAIAAPNWAEEMVRAFDVHGGRAGVVGGRVVPRWVTPRPTWLADSLLGYLSIVDWGGRMHELKSTEWLAGCNIAFEKAALISLGGFSRALGRIGAALLSNDEIEVMERMRAAGRITVYAPAATVEHVIDPARLTHDWFLRRSAWQAVSDFIQDSDRAAAYAPVAGQHLRLLLRSGRRRVPLGFYAATEDANEFKQDVGLTYDFVIATLNGGAKLEPTTTPVPLSARLTARVRAMAQTRPLLRRLAHRLRRAMS